MSTLPLDRSTLLNYSAYLSDSEPSWKAFGEAAAQLDRAVGIPGTPGVLTSDEWEVVRPYFEYYQSDFVAGMESCIKAEKIAPSFKGIRGYRDCAADWTERLRAAAVLTTALGKIDKAILADIGSTLQERGLTVDWASDHGRHPFVLEGGRLLFAVHRPLVGPRHEVSLSLEGSIRGNLIKNLDEAEADPVPPAVIDAYFRRQAGGIDDMYKTLGEKLPDLAGVFSISFTIGRDGKVLEDSVHVRLVEGNEAGDYGAAFTILVEFVAATVLRMQFPAGHSITHVENFSLRFSPDKPE